MRSRVLISMQDVLGCSCHMIWLLVVESQLGEPCLGISGISGHALKEFRHAGANALLTPRFSELFTVRRDLVVDSTPVDSHDG